MPISSTSVASLFISSQATQDLQLIIFVTHPAGSLVTAGQDSLIHVWPLPSPSSSSSTATPLLKPSNTLVGHTGNVCALGASKDGKTLVSGSWDK